MALDPDQMLLRGSSLKNTGWIYGIAIYTGHDSKVMMNSASSRPKFSKIETSTNKYIIMGICIQFGVCLVSAVFTSLWNIFMNDFSYLTLDPAKNKEKQNTIDVSKEIGENFGKWFLAMMNFVSISLLVSLEMVKFAQGMFIEYDSMMYDEEKDMAAKCQSSNLNEELGMVNYIFSDKTGTLTQNIMEFKKFSAGLVSYGSSNPLP